MIYYSTQRFTVGLIVRDDMIVDAPPIARRWALGRPAREVWLRGQYYGNHLEWLPDER